MFAYIYIYIYIYRRTNVCITLVCSFCFYFMCVDALPVYMSVCEPSVCLVPSKARKGLQIPWDWTGMWILLNQTRIFSESSQHSSSLFSKKKKKKKKAWPLIFIDNLVGFRMTQEPVRCQVRQRHNAAKTDRLCPMPKHHMGKRTHTCSLSSDLHWHACCILCQ